MISQTIITQNRPGKLRLVQATSPEHASLHTRWKRSRLYGVAAETSFILRWLALRAFSFMLKITPGRRDRRERRVIAIGNMMFRPMIARSVYASYESYVSQMESSLAQYIELYPPQRWLCGRDILDLGSGLGQYSQELLKCGAASVTGLEYQNAKMHWSASRSPSPGPRFITGSAEAMPFDTASFDTVFSHTVFEHINDVEAALGEVRRVLRPTGVALISYNFFHHRGGHHLFPYIHFPWATWVVREAALCEYWSERLAIDQATGTVGFYEPGTTIRSLSEGAEIHLNRLTFEEFERLVDNAGLQILERRSSEEIARMFPWVIRLPRLRYFFAGTFYYVLTRQSHTIARTRIKRIQSNG